MLTKTHVIVHHLRWTETVRPDHEVAVFNAHRPLRGDTVWEGAGLYGVHYAAIRRDSPDYAAHSTYNRAMDAREVTLVDNAQLLVMHAQRGGRYSVADYLAADLPVSEAMIAAGLPWLDEDDSADAAVEELRRQLA